MLPAPSDASRSALLGILYGIIAAASWAVSFVAARYGVQHGFAPADLVLYRFVAPGIAFLPFVIRGGFLSLGGVTWPRGLILAFLGGPSQSLLSYTALKFAPLGHFPIQPACAVVGGMAFAAWLVKDPVSRARLFGAFAMVTGILLFGGEAVMTIGTHGLAGDLLFVVAGLIWALFSVLLKLWSVSGIRAAMAVSVVSLLLYTPIHGVFYGYDRILAAPLADNLVQLFIQGVLAAGLPIYLFARALMLLGASRSSAFIALVPCFALVFGVAIGEIPTAVQIAGLCIVIVGFRYAIKS